MHKIFTLFLFLACTTFSFSQTVTLKGKITGPDNFPLESTTVYITSVKDSSVVDYTITNKSGNWELKTKKIDKPVFLKISYVGFADFKQQFENITEDKDFGTIKLADQSTNLNEVVIQSEIPPIRIKSDTLEFNASSFKVRPDANVEALLKQLPGVDIDDEGKITVNGKEVNQILVNGKPFFDKDGKIALQNLPAEIINKIQVTDTKTKAEETTGQKASGDNASINLTIDEEKNKGIFGKVMGGMGSDKRYESSALVNYFKGPRKVSLLASSNNINSSGFSMNELFDSMGGGRNMSVYTDDNGAVSINGQQFGGNNGITKSNMVGINYADEIKKGTDASASYFYTSADSDNRNRTKVTNFLPTTTDTAGNTVDESYTTESTSVTNDYKYAHNASGEFNVKIDSTSGIWYAPKFSKGNSKTSNTSTRFSQRINDARLLNDSEGNTFNENDNTGFSNNFNYYKRLNKRGRMFSISLDTDNKKDDGSQLTKSLTNKYNYDADGNQTVVADNRNQIRYNRQTDDSYNVKLEYFEPVGDSLKIKIGANYSLSKKMEDRDGFNYDDATGGYTQYNDVLSNRLISDTKTILPTAGFTIQKSKFYLNIEGGTQISKYDNYSYYLGNKYSVNKDYMLPHAEMNLSYNLGKSKSIYMYYNYEVNFAQAEQLLPVRDVSNPLYTSIGNPDLDPRRYHNVYLSFRDFDYATRSGYSLYAGGNYNEKDTQTFTTIDSSAVSNTTYVNIRDTYSAWMGANWNKTIKKDAHTYRFSLGINAAYANNKGFLNGTMYSSNALRLSPKLGFTYQYGELLTINPTYSYNYRQYDYTNYQITHASNFVHKINLQTTSYWPKHIVFGNDFGYTYNSQIGDGFKKDFYLWNSSLGYNFLKDRLLFKVKVYDMLNQNQATSRTLSATSIVDQENTVLKRYVMFSLTFKLDKFGKKESTESPFWWF